MFVRARFVRIYEHRDSVVVLGDDGALRKLDGPSAELASAVLDALVRPRSRKELLATLGKRWDTTKSTKAIDDLLAVLVSAGAIVETTKLRPEKKRSVLRGKIVVAISGGIAAAYAPAFVEVLIARGFAVRIAATKNALRFVQPLALEAMTHERVVAEPWPDDPKRPVPHIELARWADLVVVYPATATTLSRIATGDCSDVVSAIAITTRAPTLLVPAMNEAMLTAPSVSRNLQTLKSDGFDIAHPSLGFEVADEPSARKPSLGGAPPVVAVADLAGVILAQRPRTSL